MFVTIAKMLYNDLKEQKLQKLDPSNELDYKEPKAKKLSKDASTKEKPKGKCKC